MDRPHRLETPRLADLGPVPVRPIEHRLRVIYRIELPLKMTRVIDVLV